MSSHNAHVHDEGPLSPRRSDSSRNGGGATASIDEDLIPPLDSISPAIFVPLKESILKSSVSNPTTEADRLRLVIQRIDSHAEDVKANIVFLFRREQQRVLQAARIHEAAHGAQTPPPLDKNLVDMMMQNVMAPKDPTRDYGVHRPLPPVTLCQWPRTAREQTVYQLLTTAEGAMSNLDGFDSMMAKVREVYKKQLEAEEERERALRTRTVQEEARRRSESA
ncbi:hypothetical protein VD0002_g2125 [Verticillium dahliae]|uniref:Uncharacterized protein n=1 Tax=Verticillium dahliae TaxID=27337 RepID=A0AA44WSQ4_VERDA|nr:hypothetical protein EV126DRAFT_226418 [Verticillium dahliae]PNH36170.1 hypothetical protein BJF96_g254 [Verticillium dahliae]PNH53969.1 hypothetical protein VD0003_g3490 [Verticillium dahliae]PNH67672.1 hypothetical protein VD0002_g2125 [Verticillium dahliae]